MFELVTTKKHLKALVNDDTVEVAHYALVEEMYLEAHCYGEGYRPLLNELQSNEVHLYWLTTELTYEQLVAKVTAEFDDVLVIRSYDAPQVIEPYRFTYLAFDLSEAFEGNYEREPWYVGMPK